MNLVIVNNCITQQDSKDNIKKTDLHKSQCQLQVLCKLPV